MSKQEVTQFSVPVSNKPGTLRQLTKALSHAGINLQGITVETTGDVGFIRFIADPEKLVVPTLKKSGFQAFETPAISLELNHRPGTLAKVAENFAKAGINILNVYGTATGAQGARIVLVADHHDKAKSLLDKILDHV